MSNQNLSKEKEKTLKESIESITGPTSHWRVDIYSVVFRTRVPITLKMVIALSESLGTDEINFDMGCSGEPGYSEYTPGSDGEPGFIEIRRPIPCLDDNKRHHSPFGSVLGVIRHGEEVVPDMTFTAEDLEALSSNDE
jgi:hypothetical protein